MIDGRMSCDARARHDPDAAVSSVDAITATSRTPGWQVERPLDLAELNAVAAPLDHPVTASDVDVALGRNPADDVPGVIPGRAVAFEEHGGLTSGRFQYPWKTDGPLM